MKKMLSALLASAMALSLLAGCGGKTGGSGTPANGSNPGGSGTAASDLFQNETTFDYKKLGAQMLTNGFDLDAALADLDAKWTAARAKLGIQ